MKVFVTGVGGQLGFNVVNELKKRGYEAIGSDILDEVAADCAYVKLDITNADAVETAITEVNPDVVIHCAAWTAVDAAEDEENIPKVRAINVDGTQNIANVCKKLDCKMIYISTDYVFDGQGTAPWQPDCKDYAPQNVYGQTKLDGELAVSNTLDKYFIVRIAWVFGKNGKNFIKTMLNVGKSTTPCEWSMTRSAHRRIPTTWHGCWWIWRRPRSMAITMPPTKAAISAGMTSPVRFSGRLGIPPRWCLSQQQNMVFPRQQDPLTADWTNRN